MRAFPLPFRSAFLLAVLLIFSACSAIPKRVPSAKPTLSIPSPKGGGYYKDDGPGDEIPANLDAIPNAIPRVEPLHKAASRPYTVFGKSYVPQTRIQAFRQTGVASWYGKKFHGRKTSIGETYDMFAMTAAHPTLALPSYVRVTNPYSRQSIVVRVNDRGPFHAGRIIDLSYTAAYKLGYIEKGSGPVIVESIVPGTPLFAALAANPALLAAPAPAPAHVSSQQSATLKPPLDSQALDTLAMQFSTEHHVPPSDILERGFYLQLGAFSQPENAENLKERLLRELDWLPDPVFIHRDGNLYRLQTGPYATRIAALDVAERIRAIFGQSPALVIR